MTMLGGLLVGALVVLGLGVPAHATEAAHWTAMRNGPRPPQGVTSLSCPGVNACTAVTDNGAALEYDGATWGEVGTADQDLGWLNSVSCPTSSFCAAVGGSLAVVKKGGHWGQAFVTKGVMESVSCVSESWCLAINDAGQTWIYNGVRWRQGVRSGLYIHSVSCASRSFCIAITDPFYANQRFYRWDGTSWHGTRPGGSWQALSCGSPTLCVAVNGSAALRWNGHRWIRHTFAGFHPYVAGSVDCGRDFCQYVGPHQAAEFHHGWGRITDAAGFQVVASVSLSCASRGHCVAVAADNAAHETTGTMVGSTWTTSSYPDPVMVVDHLSCPTATFCMGGMNGGSHTRMLQDGTWTSVELPAGWAGDTQVSCTSPTFCMAWVSHTGTIATWNGSSWTTAPSLGDVSPLIDCASATYCLAVSADATASWTWNGESWTPGAAPLLAPAFVKSVTCPDTADCWVGSYAGQVEHLQGSTWASPVAITTDSDSQDGDNAVTVACGSVDLCAAFDNNGALFSWDGHQWTNPHVAGQALAVSCSSATCTAALGGPAGRVSRSDGSSWSTERALPGGYASYWRESPPGLSCPTDQVCYLADATGNTWVRH